MNGKLYYIEYRDDGFYATPTYINNETEKIIYYYNGWKTVESDGNISWDDITVDSDGNTSWDDINVKRVNDVRNDKARLILYTKNNNEMYFFRLMDVLE